MHSCDNMIYTPGQHIPVAVVIVSTEGLQLQIKHGKKVEIIRYDWLDAEVQRVAKRFNTR